MRTTMR